MNTDVRFRDDRDPEVTRLLRAAYEAPAGLAYWEGLERRIVSRIAAAAAAWNPAPAVKWWEALAEWTRAGLIAAGVAVALALAAMLQAWGAEARVAYEAVVETPPVLPSQQAMRTAGVSEREAILRYVTAY